MQETIKKSEQAIALLFALSRKVKRVTNQARQGGTPYPYPAEYRTQREIEGKQLLIIGMGDLGETIVRKVSGMDLSVAYYDKRIDDPDRDGLMVRRAINLKDALAQTDYIIVTDNKEMTDLTKDYIPEILGWLKNDAFLIDLTGNAVQYLDDIKDALAGNRLSGAGITVVPENGTLDIGLDVEDLIIVPQA